jgi:hypothetical protein
MKQHMQNNLQMLNEGNSEARAISDIVNHRTAMTATNLHEGQEKIDDINEDAYLDAIKITIPIICLSRWYSDMPMQNKSVKLQTAQNILETRIVAGVEMEHDTIKGIVVRVDGHGV